MTAQQEKVKVPCRKCGKTLFFCMVENRQKENQCTTIEIKCRNRECKEVNTVKICGTICR